MIGDQLDSPDGRERAFSGNAQIAGGLHRAGFGVVAKSREERCDCVCGRHLLDVAVREIRVEADVLLGGRSHERASILLVASMIMRLLTASRFSVVTWFLRYSAERTSRLKRLQTR